MTGRTLDAWAHAADTFQSDGVGVDFVLSRSCKPAWKWKVHNGVGERAAVGRLGRAARGQPNLGAQPSLDLSVPRPREHPSHTSTFALAYQPRGEHALTRQLRARLRSPAPHLTLSRWASDWLDDDAAGRPHGGVACLASRDGPPTRPTATWLPSVAAACLRGGVAAPAQAAGGC